MSTEDMMELNGSLHEIKNRLTAIESKLNALVPGNRRTRSTMDGVAVSTVTEARRAEFMRVLTMVGDQNRSTKLSQTFNPHIVQDYASDRNGERWHVVLRSVLLNRVALRGTFRPRTDCGETSSLQSAGETLTSLVKDGTLHLATIRELTGGNSDTVCVVNPKKLPLAMRAALGLAEWDEVKDGQLGERVGQLDTTLRPSGGNRKVVERDVDPDDWNAPDEEEEAPPVKKSRFSEEEREKLMKGMPPGYDPNDADDDDDEGFETCMGDEPAGVVEIDDSVVAPEPKRVIPWGERINKRL